MEETQEVRTVWSWDTRSVETASQRMEQAFSRVDAAEKKSVQSSATNKKAQKTTEGGGHGEGGHAGGSNFAWAIHDAAEGRMRNALGRLSTGLKLGTAATAGFFIGMKLVGGVVSQVGEQFDAADKAADRLRQSLQGLSKTATFSSAGQGAGKLAGTQEGLMEQVRSEREQQVELGDTKRIQDFWSGGIDGRKAAWATASGGTSMLFGQAYKAWDNLRAMPMFGGHQTTDQKIAESQMRERLAGTQAAQLRGKTTDAYRTETQLAYERSSHGSPFEAQRIEARKQQEVETNEARSTGNGSPQNIAAINEKYRLIQEGIDKAGRATDRQLATEANLLELRRRGGAVEVNTARERLAAATRALQEESKGTQAYKEAQNKQTAAQQDVAIAERKQGTERASYRLDLSTAGLRGGDDERAAQTAQAEVDKAQEKLRILQDTIGVKATEEELNQANLELARAQTAQEMLRRQQTAARIDYETQVGKTRRDVSAGGALLRGASPELAERQQLVAQAKDAQDALKAAQQKAAINHNDLASRKEVSEKAGALAGSQQALALHDQQIRRERKFELQGAQGETAALRFAAGGREDLGERASQRSQSQIAIEHANLEGKPQLAGQLAQQQQLRERKTVQDLYLNDDGTRRNPAAVQHDLYQRRLKATRVAQFNRAMDRNGGLTDVHRDIGGRIESGIDPLTGTRLNSREIAQRNSAAKAKIDEPKDERDDSEVFQGIFKLLDKRLPAETK